MFSLGGNIAGGLRPKFLKTHPLKETKPPPAEVKVSKEEPSLFQILKTPNIDKKTSNKRGGVYRTLSTPRPRIQQYDHAKTRQQLRTDGYRQLSLDPLPTTYHTLDSAPPVPQLIGGLERALLTPGVHLAEAFPMFLRTLHQPEEINLHAIPAFIPSSKDRVCQCN